MEKEKEMAGKRSFLYLFTLQRPPVARAGPVRSQESGTPLESPMWPVLCCFPGQMLAGSWTQTKRQDGPGAVTPDKAVPVGGLTSVISTFAIVEFALEP